MAANQKRKWWWIVLAVMLLAAIALGIFWDSAAMYLAPKTVLRKALDQTWQQLENRFSGSPLLVLSNALNEEGLNTIDLQLDTQTDLLGPVHYDMTAQTQLAPKRITATGTAEAQSGTVDLSLYLDHTFAAVSSDSLLSSQFYGITYETFPEELRGNGFLSFVLGRDTVDELSAGVKDLQKWMAGEIVIPQIKKEDIRMALMGIYALNAEVSREKIYFSDQLKDCFVIHFGATGQEILDAASLAKLELPIAVDAGANLTAAFYLSENTLQECRFDITGGKEEYHMQLTPGTDDIRIRFRTPSLHLDATISTIFSEEVYTEQIRLIQTKDGISSESVLHYSWYSDGRMELSGTRNESGHSASMYLTATEDGFHIETGDVDALLAVLADHEDNADNACTITVGKGSTFSTPAYKNFSQWSLEDILALIGSIGSLIGLGS